MPAYSTKLGTKLKVAFASCTSERRHVIPHLKAAKTIVPVKKRKYKFTQKKKASSCEERTIITISFAFLFLHKQYKNLEKVTKNYKERHVYHTLVMRLKRSIFVSSSSSIK